MGHDDGCTAVPIEGWLAFGGRPVLVDRGGTVPEAVEGLVSCDILVGAGHVCGCWRGPTPCHGFLYDIHDD